MRILVLTNKLPYPARDGGSIATLNMLSGLSAAGNDITCLSLNTSKHNFPVEIIDAKRRRGRSPCLPFPRVTTEGRPYGI